MHKAWRSIEEVPYCFVSSSINFQGHTDWNWRFESSLRLPGRSQLSNPSDLPCLSFYSAIIQWKFYHLYCKDFENDVMTITNEKWKLLWQWYFIAPRDTQILIIKNKTIMFPLWDFLYWKNKAFIFKRVPGSYYTWWPCGKGTMSVIASSSIFYSSEFRFWGQWIWSINLLWFKMNLYPASRSVSWV